MSDQWKANDAVGKIPITALVHSGTDDERLTKLENAVTGIARALAEAAGQLEFVTGEIAALR